MLLSGLPLALFAGFVILIFCPFSQIGAYAVGHDLTALADTAYGFLVASIFTVFISRNPVKQRLYLPRGIATTAVLLTLTTIFSAIINDSSLLNTLQSFRWIVLFFGLAYLLPRLFASNKPLIRLFIVVSLINVILCVVQRIVYVVHLGLGSGDIVTGVFSNYYELVLFQICCILIDTQKRMTGKYDRKIPYLLAVLLHAAPMMLSNSKASWVYLGLGLCVLVGSAQIGMKRKLQLVGTSLTVILISLIAFNLIFINKALNNRSVSYSAQHYEYIVNPTYMLAYQLGRKSFGFIEELSRNGIYNNNIGRFGRMAYNYFRISGSTPTLLLGLGPTSDENYVHGERIGTPYLNGGTAIQRLLGQLGVIGTLVMGLYFPLLIVIPNKLTSRKSVSAFYRAIWAVSFGMLFYFGLPFSKSASLVIASTFLPWKLNAD